MSRACHHVAVITVAIVSSLAFLLHLSPPSDLHTCNKASPTDNRSYKSYASIYLTSIILRTLENVADLTSGDPIPFSSAFFNYGRPLLRKESVDDIELLQRVVTSKKVLFDPIRRILDVRDLAVHAPSFDSSDNDSNSDSNIAFHIGRVRLTWGSYLTAAPCIDVHVEDISIRVVFADLLLTRTNFDVLREFGFPPALVVGSNREEIADDEEMGKTRDAELQPSRVRVGSVSLKGRVKLTLESAALRGGQSATAAGRKLVEDLVLDLSVLRVLEDRIREKADRNGVSGRKGVTTEDLVVIIGQHFRDEVVKTISLNLADLARGEDARGVVQGIAALHHTKAAFLAYFGEAVETVAEREIEAPIGNLLRRWGLEDEQTKWLRDKAAVVIRNSVLTATSAAADKIEELLKKETTGESEFDTVLQVQQDLF